MKEQRSSRLTWLLALVSLLLFVPLGILAAQRYRPVKAFEVVRGGSSFPESKLPLDFSHLRGAPDAPARILNVNVVELNGAAPPEILVCDGQAQRVFLYEQNDDGEWIERSVGDQDIVTPAHTTVVDLDQDNDLDILVAVLGDPWPTNERVGAVVWMENDGKLNFTTHYLLDDLRRVTDIQAGDLDNDGDLDLAVAEFGFTVGGVLWLENLGDKTFRDHQLLAGPGAIHVPIADFDQDGDLDIVTIVTQEEEEIWAFENTGDGEFSLKPRLLNFNENFDLGGAGLISADLDQDGDQDLIMAAGDNLDLLSHYPQPYHGCYWFENKGDWRFDRKRLSEFGGAYASAVGDLDGDNDNDIVLVSFCNDWMVEGNASIVWLENDGEQNFTTWQIADRPIQMVTVDCGDINGDGRDDIVAGAMQLKPPFDRRGRVGVWLSRDKAEADPKPNESAAQEAGK